MAAPLAVLVGLKDPQELLLQVTVQLTPPLAVSLATVAVRLAVAPAAIDVGGLLIVTVIAGAAMVMMAEPVAPEAVVAVMVTEVGADGAVYVVAVPLAVEVELNDPHGDVAQVAVQVTPAPLLTVAVMDAVAPGLRDAGCPLRVTVTVAGGGVEPPPPPQPVSVMAKAVSVTRRMLWRSFIAHLRSSHDGFWSRPRFLEAECGSRPHWKFGYRLSDCR